MKLRTRILALFVAIVFIGTVAAMNLQQASAFGFVERQQIGEFRELTGNFVGNVINAVGNPDEGPEPHIAEFRQLTAQFERNVIDAVLLFPK